MKKWSHQAYRVFKRALIATLAAVVGAALFAAAAGVPPQTAFSETRPLNGMTYRIEDGETGQVSLPYSFENLQPRSAVTLFATITGHPGESLLVKTVYAPLKIYADDILIYACGQEGSYPAFLLDPPTMLGLVKLPETEGALKLRFEFLSPTQRSTLSISAIMVGSEMALLARLFSQTGFSFLFSLIVIFMGVTLTLVALILLRTTPKGSPFLWLGLFALGTGVWGFGENNLSVFLLPSPSLLYVMAFAGLFTVAIPLLQFGLLVLQPHPHVKRALALMQALLCAAVIVAFALQLAGVVGLHKSMYLFHLIVPLAFVLLAACVLWEHIGHKNPAAKHFTVPMVILASFATLELVNYQLHFTSVISLFFQIGMLFFIISMGFVGGHFTREALETQAEKARLEMEVISISRLMDIQKDQYLLLKENAEAVKAQRHDLRHQLAVVKRYNDSGDAKNLAGFLDELTAKVPLESETALCENFAVNAVALHYLNLAKSIGIDVSLRLDIPHDIGRVQDSDLCIVVGNFFENGIEACKNIREGERFIKIASRISCGLLTITMDNSFDGVFDQKDGAFHSRKRAGIGTGLSSVKAVAAKYDGSAKFEAQGKVFLSSMYVKTAGD